MPRPAEPLADATWMKADTCHSLRQKIDATPMPDDVRPLVDSMILDGQRTRKRSILDRHDALDTPLTV
jgi:hypothetical protein